ncbi:MAG: hypothetical protein ACLGPL_01035 [Acidobacteriota bacterium]
MASYYDISDELHTLLQAWARWRAGKGAPRTLTHAFQRITEGPFDVSPAYIHVERGTAPLRYNRSEDFNQAVLRLQEWQIVAIQIYVMVPETEEGVQAWKDFMRQSELSERVWQSTLADLQEECRKRGLL